MSVEYKLDMERVRELCRMALAEDLGDLGDTTTKAIVPPSMMIEAYFIPRQECVCCGMPVLKELFRMLDPAVEFKPNVDEGTYCLPGARMATVTGSAQAILTGERTALNFLQRLSGVATVTHRYVEALGNCKTKILDTRKTTPGYRDLEKYAVATGGGTNHRIGLYDRIMIKDNHRELAKLLGPDSIQQAVDLARKRYPQLKVEVEADSLEDVQNAVNAKADIILLDNMSDDDMFKALKIINGLAESEASGGITLKRLPSLARLGLTYISVGALTHSAPSVDIGLDI